MAGGSFDGVNVAGGIADQAVQQLLHEAGLLRAHRHTTQVRDVLEKKVMSVLLGPHVCLYIVRAFL